jgi:hypothetical protein
MLPQLLLGPLVYCIVFLNITSPRASFGTYYWALFSAYLPVVPYARAGWQCLSNPFRPPDGSTVVRFQCRSHPVLVPPPLKPNVAGVYYVAAGFAYIVSIMAPPSLAQLVGYVPGSHTLTSLASHHTTI